MKLAMVGLVALVIGLAVGTLTAPAPEPPAAPASEVVPEGPDATAAVGGTVAEPPADSTGDAPTGTATTTPTEVSPMAAALEGLTPAQAAPVLARLPEPEVLRLLQAVPIERAAALLEALPADQSARLSRQLLVARGRP